MRKNVLLIIIIELVLGVIIAFCPYEKQLQLRVPKSNGTLCSVEYQGEKQKVFDNESTICVKDPDSITTDLSLCADTSDIEIDVVYGPFCIRNLSPEEISHNISEQYVSYPQNLYFTELTLSEAINKYHMDDYIIMVAASGEVWGNIDNHDVKAMCDIGASITKDTDVYSSYILLVNGNKIEYECVDNKVINYNNVLGGHSVEIVSSGAPKMSSICIDGKEYSTEDRGIHLVIYDKVKNELIDSLSFDTNDDSMMTRYYNLFYTIYEMHFGDRFFNYVKIMFALFKGLLSVLIICILLFAVRIEFSIFEMNPSKFEKNGSIRFGLSQIIMCLFMLVAVLLHIGYTYLINNYDVSISQLIYHLNTDLAGANWAGFSDLLIKLLAGTIFVVIINIILYTFLWRLRKTEGDGKYKKASTILRILVLLLSFTSIGGVICKFYKNYDVLGYLIEVNLDSHFFDTYYIDADQVNIKFPVNKRNLIYIFLESMEITYADETAGGGKTDNIIPELSRLAFENDCFNGDSNKLNGARVLSNTGWTIAAMVAQTAGIPLSVPVGGNDYGYGSFLSGCYSIGDILEEKGYNNCLMLGSDAKFAQRENYFTQHGNYEICDYEWAKDNHKISEDYYVWWGYEDVKLFEYAKEKILSLSQSDKPFNFTMLTVDTHFTDGYLCEDCNKQFAAQYSNVLACSSRQVDEFVNWIKEQDFYENTVIVIAGDHLCMDTSYFSDVSDDYERTTYVAIVNSSKKQTNEKRLYSTLDLFPTTLSAMGCEIEGNRLGLGTDLYSDEATLTELLGVEECNYNLGLKSEYYERNILYVK